MTTITTSHVEDADGGATFLGIADMDEWAEFWEANGEALTEEVGERVGDPETFCRSLAMNCSLLVGGGAAPLFRVGFVD